MAELAKSLAARQQKNPVIRTEIRDFLRAIGFFQGDRPQPESLAVTLAGDAFRPSQAVLFLTNQCQLRCIYCYAAAGEHTLSEMSLETGQAAIDFVSQNARSQGLPEFLVSFHGGGEPTAAWKSMQQLTGYARQKSLPAKIDLTSNGIWTRPQREWIVANLDKVTLSMDGSPATQDRQRPRASGRGSSPQIMRSIAALDQSSFKYGIRLTVTDPWGHFPEDIRFLCENTGCQSLQVEPAFNQLRGMQGWQTEVESQGFAKVFLDAYDIARQAGRSLTFSGARPGAVTTSFCSAPFTPLIVNPTGKLVGCFEVCDDSHPLSAIVEIGSIESRQVIIDEAARTRLNALLEERRATCRDCYCYWSCAGDCLTRAWKTGPGGHLVHGFRCQTNRYLTAQLLLRAITANNGVWCSFQQPVSTALYSPETPA